MQYLNKSKIGTRLLFSGNLTKQPYMKDKIFRVSGNLDKSDFAMENTFWVGVYPALTKLHLAYIIEKLKFFFK